MKQSYTKKYKAREDLTIKARNDETELHELKHVYKNDEM